MGFGVAANTIPIVNVGTDDRPVAKFDATMWYVINGTLQRKFLTCLSFALGVDASARPIVKVSTDDRLVAQFDATMWSVINGTLQREFLTCLSFALGVDANAIPIEEKIQCGMSLSVLSNWNF